jgi:hypothetical protein
MKSLGHWVIQSLTHQGIGPLSHRVIEVEDKVKASRSHLHNFESL